MGPIQPSVLYATFKRFASESPVSGEKPHKAKNWPLNARNMATKTIEPFIGHNASTSPPQQSASLKHPRQGLRDAFALWLLLQETWLMRFNALGYNTSSSPPQHRSASSINGRNSVIRLNRSGCSEKHRLCLS